VSIGRLLVLAEDVRVVVRHHRLCALAGLHFLAADDERHVDFLGGHRPEARFERRALGVPGAYERKGSLTGGGTRRRPLKEAIGNNIGTV